MKIRRLEELRKIHFDIKAKVAISDHADRKANEAMLLETVKKVMELSWIARREGLLALEEVVENIPVESKEEPLKQLIVMLIEGTEAQVLEEIGLGRYYAHLYTDYEALRYVMYLECVLSIRTDEHPSILEERLKGMLPADMYLRYSLEREKQQS